jgi:hypothetical protein
MFRMMLMTIFTNFHMNYLNWTISNVLLQMFNELLWNIICDISHQLQFFYK